MHSQDGEAWRKSRLISGLCKGITHIGWVDLSEGSAHTPSDIITGEAHWSLSTGAPEGGMRPGPGIMKVICMYLKSPIS